MDVVEGQGRLAGALARPQHGQPPVFQAQGLEAAAGDVFHHQAVGIADLVGVVGHHDIRDG